MSMPVRPRVRMHRMIWLLAPAALLGGCNTYNLPYAPVKQPDSAHLYADYFELQNKIGVLIDTDGHWLESASIDTPQGAVRPLSVQMPGAGRGAMLAPGVGFGAGPAGLGVGTALPVGPAEPAGLTTATFDRAAIGNPPWKLHIKVRDLPETEITLQPKAEPAK